MLSTSIAYVLALLVCAVVFRNIRSCRVRQAVILTASYALYVTWGFWFAAVLITSTLMNFAVGQWVRRKPSSGVLWFGILLNLLLLGTFKYLPSVAVNLPFSSLQRFAHLALPLGISFWTFQAISYLADVYRGDDIAPSLWEFALYMVYFPIAISGPVCRMEEMLPQFRSERLVAWDEIGRGLSRIATGVLMMRLSYLLGQGVLAGDGINSGFDHLNRWTGPDVWCLAFGYGLQLFFDFAGYSHIAIGAAKVLGISLPENFARPFESSTPSVFWTRWHMSLSFWIRDYVFLPLAVLRREMWWRNLALLLSMVLFGLWHKASVLFLLWGCYHGVLLLMHRQVQELQRKFDWSPPSALWTPLSHVTTIAAISLGWVFFRAGTLNEAKQMLLAVASPGTYSSHFISGSLYVLVVGLSAGYALVLLAVDMLDRYSVEPGPSSPPTQQVIWFIARNRWFWVSPLYALALLIVSAITLTQASNAAQFMYRGF